MFGNATLYIPRCGNIGPSRTPGLSDELAMAIGRAAGRTLSEEDGYVTVILESGETKLIGHDTIRGELVMGRLTCTDR